jgi:hypothetical protein
MAFGGMGGAPLRAVIGAVLGVMLVGPSLAAGEPAIAKAVDVRPQATGAINGATVVLSAADDLFEGQTIVTGTRGQVQILFSDETKMVVGPGSSLVIEKYLMRSGGKASAFAVSALGGTFRFITGKSAKDVYKIDTPTGTIGVRGTKFDFTVTKRKTNIVIFDGEVTYCANGGDCASVSGTCNIGTGDASNANVVGSGSSSGGNFIYVDSQSSLNSGFKVNGAGACGGGDTTTPSEAKQEASAPEQGSSKPEGKPDPIPDPLP